MVPPPSTQMAEIGNLSSEAQAYHTSNLPTPPIPPRTRSQVPRVTISSRKLLQHLLFTPSSLLWLPTPPLIPHTAVRRRNPFQSTLIHSSLAENPSRGCTHLGKSSPTQDGHKASPSPPPTLSVPPPLYPENLPGGAPLLQHTDPSTCQVVHSAAFQSSRRSRLPQPPA